MNRLSVIARTGKVLVLTLAIWAALQGAALAQGSGEDSGGNTIYIMPYGVVVLCLCLGLAAVCRPSRRDDRPDIDQFETDD